MEENPVPVLKSKLPEMLKNVCIIFETTAIIGAVIRKFAGQNTMLSAVYTGIICGALLLMLICFTVMTDKAGNKDGQQKAFSKASDSVYNFSLLAILLIGLLK